MNQLKARRACAAHRASSVARPASRHADTVAHASTGCWSNEAFDPFRG